MLSSRYLHLHEALELGPMWLNRNARVIATAPVAAPERVLPEARPSETAQAASVSRPPQAAALRTAPKPAETAPAAAAAATPVAPPELPRLDITVGRAEIMIAAACPSTADCLSGRPFDGNPGILLDNMLAAIGLRPEQAHKTVWVKTAPIADAVPQQADIEAALPELRRELEQSGAKAVLLVGKQFEQADMVPLLEKMCGSTPYFVLPHPARLLRMPNLKAAAWQTLKQAARALGTLPSS